ncbi:transposase [Sporosarcina sp. Marseille-Q4063]|uniref:transposase n=1 Tax=Sporosarcina sp. Marseille-Q4063 TaxID=2810514 RepID=UPI001BAF394A|nr:transposase [Sporosarcina sp. Marseille-Q4063]QUW22601.1 transposase [Sporosarcina sp. Marseille-Q4063]
MNEIFVKSLSELIVKENLESYKDLYETTVVDSKTDPYYKEALNLYNSISEEKRVVLMNIIEQTMVDTISSMLGIIDGSIPLDDDDDSIEPKLLLNSVDTEGELQDQFLEFIEGKESGI